MKLVHTVTSALILFSSLAAQAAPATAITKKILSQGVPVQAYEKLVKFMDEFQGRSFNQDTYTCEGRDASSVKPCEEEKRTRSNKTVTLNSPTYVAIVDFGSPSSQRRFYLINLKTGDVNKYYVSHGLGSGSTDIPTKFSNIKDSKQTSLGMYLTGEVYQGHYGNTLRMYGLERSNDEAYNRDIVLHGAWYVGEDFINSTNERTGQKYGRLGVSWGCPAVSRAIADKIIPLLKGGSLIMHYHPTLMDEALSGKEVRVSQK
ncbi:murein L,D-transpeptidase catalytic domain family protein [Bdellovibrio sp. BCCA]|uniref:murein L,D-transpeptidase catalytic domain family protein n=1 Tax=Bdellovibrio sp. BCCA TaxID=3136281 RepID=UPI0030F2100A